MPDRRFQLGIANYTQNVAVGRSAFKIKLYHALYDVLPYIIYSPLKFQSHLFFLDFVSWSVCPLRAVLVVGPGRFAEGSGSDTDAFAHLWRQLSHPFLSLAGTRLCFRLCGIKLYVILVRMRYTPVQIVNAVKVKQISSAETESDTDSESDTHVYIIIMSILGGRQ